MVHNPGTGRQPGASCVMDVIVKQWLSSAVLILGTLGIVVALLLDLPQFADKYLPPRLRKHPRFWSVISCLLMMGISLHFIWQPPSVPPSTMSIASQPQDNTPKGPVINQQAEEMAIEFRSFMAKVIEEDLSEEQVKDYADYLDATMPAKIESICGTEECRKYEHILEGVRRKSDAIQHHFRGLEPFVCRKRFIDSNTPTAGPKIEIAIKDESKETQQIIVSKPPIIDKDELPPAIPPREQTSPRTDPKPEPPAIAVPETRTEPPHVADTTPNPLAEYLNKLGWVQCRKCGKVHHMTYSSFARVSAMYCQNCNFHMHFEAFSKKIAAEANRLNNEAAAKYR